MMNLMMTLELELGQVLAQAQVLVQAQAQVLAIKKVKSLSKKDLANNISIKEGYLTRDSSFFLDEVIKFIKINKDQKSP